MKLSCSHFIRPLPLAGALILAITFIAVIVRRFLTRRQFARRHGCQRVKAFHDQGFLGICGIRDSIRAARDHKALEQTSGYFRTYGNTFATKVLRKRIVLTVEPENIKTILSIRFKDYGLGFRLKTFAPLLGKGIFTTDGDHWATSRALIRPNFTRSQVADLSAFENLISDLFALIPRDGITIVDLQDLFFSYTIDSATEFLFGRSVCSLQKTRLGQRSEREFAEAFNYAQNAISTRGSLGPFGVFYRDAKADESNRICRAFVEQFVDDAIRYQQSAEAQKRENDEKKSDKYVFLHELARATTDKRRLQDELMNVLLAGRDTTASLLSNLFFMLAKHPAIWAKLRAEVATLEGRLPTYEELRNLVYLKSCLNECKTSLSLNNILFYFICSLFLCTDDDHQLSVCTLSSQAIVASQQQIRYYRSEEERMVNPHYLSPREQW